MFTKLLDIKTWFKVFWIKALIEVYQELTKKTYVAGSSDSTVLQRTRTATVNFSKPIEEDLIKKNKEVLAQAV